MSDGRRLFIYTAGVVLALLVNVAYAQQTQPPQEKTYTLTFSTTEVNLMGRALEAMPYREVAPLFNNLQAQLNKQNQPVPPTSPAPSRPMDKKGEESKK